MILRFIRRIGLALLMVSSPSAAWQNEYVQKNPEEGEFRAFIVTGGILLFFGVICCVIAIALNYQQVRSGFWPTTSGVIEVSETRTFRSGYTTVQVSYSYAVDGTRYGSSRRSIVDETFRDMRYAIEETDRYPVGQIVTVSYDPHDPSFAILEAGYDLMSDWFFVIGFCLVVLGIGFFCLQLARSMSQGSDEHRFRSPERLP